MFLLFNPLWKTRVAEPAIKPEEWRKVLRGAADLIDTHGHVKFDLESEDGRLCMMGAICKAAAGDARNGGSCIAHQAVWRVEEEVGTNICTYNNLDTTTAADASAVLRRAAAA